MTERKPAARRGNAGSRGTLLSKMGFADKDRQDPMHDAACGYIAANAARVYASLTKSHVVKTDVTQEILITKGSGQYQTTIGFADLAITAEIWIPHRSLYAKAEILAEMDVSGLEDEAGRLWTYSQPMRANLAIGIEVKWTEASFSDAVRQISVYREYCVDVDGVPRGWRWALAAPWTLNVEQRSLLNSQNIAYVQLSRENVEAWAAKNRSTKAAPELVL